MSKRSNNINESAALAPLRPTLSDESAEIRCASLALNLVEQRLRNGTATSQEVCTCLRLGILQLERDNLKAENELKRAKVNNLNRQDESNVDYNMLMKELRKYRGQPVDDEDDEDRYYE